MIGKGYVVEWDLYDIASRLREIDDGQFIFYSYKTKRYEIHNRRQRGSTLALILPYDKLDARALNLVRRTSCERASDYLKEIERENARVSANNREKAVKLAQKQMETALIKATKQEQ